MLLMVEKNNMNFFFFYQSRVPLHVFHQRQQLVQFGLVNLKILTAAGGWRGKKTKKKPKTKQCDCLEATERVRFEVNVCVAHSRPCRSAV